MHLTWSLVSQRWFLEIQDTQVFVDPSLSNELQEKLRYESNEAMYPRKSGT